MNAPELLIIVTPDTLELILIAGPPALPFAKLAFAPLPPRPIILPLFSIVQGISTVSAAVDVLSDQTQKSAGITNVPPSEM